MSIHDFPSKYVPPPPPPGNNDMESRVSKLESASEKVVERLNSIDLKLARIETKLDHLEKDAVTKDGMKASISEAKNSIIMWVVGALFLAQLLPALLKKFGL